MTAVKEMVSYNAFSTDGLECQCTVSCHLAYSSLGLPVQRRLAEEAYIFLLLHFFDTGTYR